MEKKSFSLATTHMQKETADRLLHVLRVYLATLDTCTEEDWDTVVDNFHRAKEVISLLELYEVRANNDDACLDMQLIVP